MADLVSGDLPFAMQCPEAALLLMVTIPSARPAVVALRKQISTLIGPVIVPMLRAGPVGRGVCAGRTAKCAAAGELEACKPTGQLL